MTEHREHNESRRRLIEARLASGQEELPGAPEEVLRLIHDLRVHQIELEMQNEELRRTQLELEQARDRYVELYDLAPVCYLTLDRRGTILEANHAAAALLGVERRDLRGRHLSAFMQQDDADRLHLHLSALGEPGQGRASIEVALHREGGEERRALLHSLAAQEGGVAVFRTTAVDCTPLRAAEQLLREREARLRAILDAVVDGVITTDTAGVIESLNPAASRIFGYPREELLGRGIALLLPAARGKDGDDLARCLRMAPAGKNTELVGRRKDGTTIPLELGVGEVRADPVQLLVIACCDISQRQQQEQELRHAQRLDAIGTLASGIAHDFNNLLMAIGGSAKLALLGLEEGEPPPIHLQQIIESVRRGAGLTRQILGFAGKRSVRPEPIELDSAITDAGGTLRRLLGDPIELTLRLLAPGACVLSERGEIGQILMNLVTNARDAMPGGGALLIETRRDGGERPGVTLRMRDTGCGMDEATRARAFEPFFTNKEIGKGSGLGLAMVSRVVKHLGGTIQVTSEVGRGTEFTLWFPETEGQPISR